MSQAGILTTTAGPVPPTVPTSFVTNSGTAVPAANILNVLAQDSTSNDDNGITDTGSGNTVTMLLTNRATGTISTADGSLTTVLTFPMGATPGVYFIEGNIVAFNTTDTAGGAYAFTSAVRSTGAAGTEIGTEFKDLFEEVAMAASDIFVSASGNNILLQVQGVAGKAIDWNAFLTYRFVS